MHLLVLLVCVAGSLAQDPAVNIDPTLLATLFGTPPPPTPSVTAVPPRSSIETITVKPTDSPKIITSSNGDQCQCVPYYLCNDQNIAVHIDNSSVTGVGQLDIRFGEGTDSCQESVELCCTLPAVIDPVDVTVPPPPKPKACGYRNRKGIDFTIKGGVGNEAEFGEFPWVVALMETNPQQTYVGVGVLIHPQVVMTGAHVAAKYQPGGLKIRAGEWDTQTLGERLKHQERGIREIYIHKDFNSKNLFNDMALLLLDQPVELAQHINVICLPDQDENFDSSRNCVANGWGKNVFGKQGRYVAILKKLEIDMVPHQRCNDLLKRTRLGHKFRLHPSFVCAGGEEGKDLCTGDGGAPLACPVAEDRYKLTGLVAWGIGCGGKDIPAVYANVPAFRRWVDSKMAAWNLDTSVYRLN